MNSVCIYHSRDLDGWMSAAIVKHWFITNEVKKNSFILDGTRHDSGGNPNNAPSMDFIGWDYGNDIPDLKKFDEVIMCDISFPVDNMKEIAKTKKFVWIDHHISAIKDNAYLIDLAQCEGAEINYFINPSFSACELTWKYFFNEEMPEIVRLLGRYDCFGHKGTGEELKVLEFQYGARSLISGYQTAYQYLMDCINTVDYKKGTVENDIHLMGMSIYVYLKKEAEQIYKRAFPMQIGEYLFLCVNQERFNPINFGINYHDFEADWISAGEPHGFACFWYKNGLWNFSLYNDNGHIDCSKIAKLYGGGGHKGAAGFLVGNINEFLAQTKL